MMLFFFLSMCCVGVIKPMSTSLCIHRIGFGDWRYPALYGFVALVAGPIVLLFQYLAKRLAHGILLIATVGIFLLTFGIFHFVLFRWFRDASWIYFVFYAWSGLLTLLIPTLGWVISYDLYSLRVAKRLFGLLATGGVLGGAAGSFSAYFGPGQKRLEWEVLLFLVLLGVMAILLYRQVQSRARQGIRPAAPERRIPEANRHSLRSILKSPYVLYLAGLVLLAALATTLIDLNYQWILKERYPQQAGDLTKVLSLLLGTMYLLSACVNLFGQRLLKRFGLPTLLLVTPLSLGGASLVTAVFSRFWPVLAGKAMAGILSPSLHRTGVEMLYVPLASRKTTLSLKSFVDLSVYKVGDALGAVLFLVLMSVVAVRPVRMTAVIQIAAACTWALFAFRLGKEYVHHLRSSVRAGIVIEPAVIAASGHPEVVLLDALQSADPVRIRLGLMGLRQLDTREDEPHPQFPFEGENLMQTKVSAISPIHERWKTTAAAMFNHPNPEIGAAALHLLVRQDPVHQLRRIRAKLDSEWVPEPVYIYYLDRYVDHPGKLLQAMHVLRWCQNLPEDHRVVMARVMGKSRNPAFLPVLRQWAQQEPGAVRAAAIEAIGRFEELRFLPFLCNYLGHYWSRQGARRSLMYYGDKIVPYCVKLLRDSPGNPKIVREIPLVLGSIRSSSSRGALVGALYHPDPIVSFRALQALNRIREMQELSYALESFQPVVEFWARQYYSLVNLESLHHDKGPCGKLLLREIEVRKRNTVERIFRTLELFLPRGDAHHCYRVIVENRNELRDHAIELIDTQLNARLKAVLIPLLAESNVSELAASGRKLFNMSGTAEAVFSEALVETDPWIRCCILSAIREWSEVRPVLFDSVQRCCSDINPLVRETAQWVKEGLQGATHRTETARHVENN